MSRNIRPIAVGLGVVGVVGALAGCSGPAIDRNYLDGIYSADGRYTSPAGIQAIGVALELQNGHIAWISVTPRTYIGEPGEFQGQFAAGVPMEVVGKDIDDVDVSRVAGSSLTSAGFNQALALIKDEAAED